MRLRTRTARRRARPDTAPTRPRDSQRKRCYDAERLLAGAHEGRRLPTLADVRDWLDHALAQEPDAPPVELGTGSGSRRARATWDPQRGHRLQLPRHARTELVLCHELAHVLVAHRHGIDGAAAHGWQWASTYLDLTARHLCPETAERLREAFARTGVRTAPRD